MMWIAVTLGSQAGIICPENRLSSLYKDHGDMAINESKLTKGQVRKLKALRKSVGSELGEEVFSKWLAQQATAAAEPKRDTIALKIEDALGGFVGDKSFRLGNYGYTIRRARGKGVSGFVVTKNAKPQ